MRSLEHCRGCGDAIYDAARANWRNRIPSLEGLYFCPDLRRAEPTPRIGCVRLAAKLDPMFVPLVSALADNEASTKARWAQKLAKAAAILVMMSALGVSAKKPGGVPVLKTCTTKDPWSCGGSPSRCDCSGKACKCVIVVSQASVCTHCTPRAGECRGGAVCSCTGGACCCE